MPTNIAAEGLLNAAHSRDILLPLGDSIVRLKDTIWPWASYVIYDYKFNEINEPIDIGGSIVSAKKIDDSNFLVITRSNPNTLKAQSINIGGNPNAIPINIEIDESEYKILGFTPDSIDHFSAWIKTEAGTVIRMRYGFDGLINNTWLTDVNIPEYAENIIIHGGSKSGNTLITWENHKPSGGNYYYTSLQGQVVFSDSGISGEPYTLQEKLGE